MGLSKIGIVLTGLSLVALPSEMANAQTPVLQYEVVDFSALTGYSETFGFGLSELGHTLIRAETEEADSRAFFVFDEGSLIELVDFTPGGARFRPSHTFAPVSPMNSVGQIIGETLDDSGFLEFGIYDDGTITLYELPEGLSVEEIRTDLTINAHQHAIMESGPPFSTGRGHGTGVFLFAEGQSTLMGYGSCEHDCSEYARDFLVAFNDNGQALFHQESPEGAAGWLYDANTGDKRFLMPDSPPPDDQVFAIGLNNAGVVLGSSRDDGPFVWDDGQITLANELLAPHLSWDISSLRAINNLGQILGGGRETPESFLESLLIDGDQVSIVPIRDLLPDELGTFDIADFNARGEILVNGRVNGIDRAFLLIPIPEPAGLGVFALAALFLPRRQLPTATRHRLT